LIRTNHNCIVVLGPTASGKTHLACQLAYYLNGEIVSADSRQVYKGLDIGTGKDLEEYKVKGKKIPYHLIDVNEPDEQFYLHDFIRELKKSFIEITERGKLPIICGGTGLYLEALEKDHSLTQIPENNNLRTELNKMDKEELIKTLQSNRVTLSEVEGLPTTDLDSKKRIIRGIEIAEYLKTNPLPKKEKTIYNPKYIGIKIDKEERNKRIDARLKQRLENGLIEEVQGLLKKGITHERLQFLGLEYKFISFYLLKQITKKELFTLLSTAIHQFAKRQMTWYRRMEKNGVNIEWVELKNIDPLISKLKIEMQ
jgi:tRNA dimethylallyltransferase